MAGILEFLSAGYFHKSVNVDENCLRWQNGLVSKLHKSIGTLLGLFTCTVFAKELLGDHIHCIRFSEETQVSEASFNSYCYISSTFTLPHEQSSEDHPYPGVGPVQQDTDPVHHSYYQWVPYLLFLQAISFYTPYTFYKFSQDGRISSLLQNLQNVLPYNENREDKLGDIHIYLQDFYGSHTWWARKLMISDFLNLINIVFNIIIMDWYLGSNFLTYGPTVISYQMGNYPSDPFDNIFPKMTKCTLALYGPSGTVQNYDGLCVLPINVLNEKIYFLLWILLFPVAVLTVIDQGFWLVMVVSKQLRNSLLCSFVLSSRPQIRQRLRKILESLPFSDWLVLYLVARNIDSVLFTGLAEKIHPPGLGYFPEEDE
ncbi:innexin inx2 [Eurytemora carolleeae]|uniref:innexin inx2 n=1 Tax=Eurytemora carolleeae TaxID=1294199 RepID=UPI000C78FD17|nr:innexin inx2 [Eurytemora carolleeae]|eukprot:XP_023324554.1 innexin inx2-like [Eurytemora affinis]